MKRRQALGLEGARGFERDQRANTMAEEEEVRSRNGASAAVTLSTIGAMSVIPGSRNLAPRPGGLMASTSSHPGRPAGQLRKA